MRLSSISILVLSLLIIGTFDANAGSVLEVDNSDQTYHLNQFGDYVSDAEPVDTPEALLAQNITFKPLDPNSEAFVGTPQREPVWLRFSLKNTTAESVTVIMQMTTIIIDYWDVFIPEQDGFKQVELGDHRPFSNREFISGPYVISFTLAPGQEATYYARAQNPTRMVLPVKLYTGNAYQTAKVFRTGYFMLFTGVALGLFLFSLMLGLQTRDLLYIIYSALVLMRIGQLIISEGSIYYLTQSYPLFNNMSLIFLATLYTCSSLLFHTVFLRINEFYPIIHRFVLVLIGLYIVFGLIVPFFSFPITAFFLQTAVYVVNSFIIISSLWRLLQGYKPALWYLCAVMMPVVMTTYSISMSNGTVNYNDNGTFILGLVYSISLILFSFALSSRIKALDYEKTAAETEALQARVEAQTKSDFLAQMSHEIRTPMNGVLGISELMSKTPLDEQQQKYNRIIHSSGKLLLQVIDDVLDYSKIQAGKMTIENIQFDPRELCNEMREVFLAKFEEKGLQFKVDVADSVPARLCGDPTRIRQILFNLVNNGFKFTAKGSITLSLEKEADSPLYKFSVQDTGIGISPSGQKNLFMPYYQTTNSTTRKYGGTGLGLSICKQLCELMNGDIGMQSREGEGSRFWFTLELNEVDKTSHTETQDADGQKRLEVADQGARSLHVLVAEDNPVNQIVAQGMLSTLGHTFQSVSNGREAVELIKSRETRFDLILMDCEMPELDGISATREIRASEEGGSIPIVALTAHALDHQIENCKQAGMNHHLPKPFKLEDLRNILCHY